MRIAIISDDPGFLQHTAAVLLRDAHDVTPARGSAADAPGIVASLRPDLLLLDARHAPEAELGPVEQVTSHHPHVAVILLCEAQSPEFLMNAMRAGVREVLPSPAPAALLAAAVGRVAAKHAAAQPRSSGNIRAFIGSSGGSGTTFLATNFGFQLARTHKVLLVDLNLQFGDALSFLQDGAPPTTVADLAKDIKRLDVSLLQASTVKVTPNFSILAAPDEPAQAAEVSAEHIDAILRLAVTQYDYVLLDMPRFLDPVLINALDKAAAIFLVVQASVTHMRNAAKLLSVFRSLDYADDKIELIVNRYDKRDDITLDKIERTLGPYKTHTIANAYRQVSTAINQGVPLMQIEGGNGVVRSLGHLSHSVSPAPGQPYGLLKRLFKTA
jgi:pilus assembly protein CpaE